MPAPFTTPVAQSTPFEAGRNPGYAGSSYPFVSTDVQNAIEEAYKRAIDALTGFARWVRGCGFDGNATVGRWLEFMENSPGNNNPLVLPKVGAVTDLTLSTNGNTTLTITLFKNGVSTGVTISTSASSRASLTLGTPVSFIAGDYLNAQVTAGSGNRPQLEIWGRFE